MHGELVGILQSVGLSLPYTCAALLILCLLCLCAVIFEHIFSQSGGRYRSTQLGLSNGPNLLHCVDSIIVQVVPY